MSRTDIRLSAPDENRINALRDSIADTLANIVDGRNQVRLWQTELNALLDERGAPATDDRAKLQAELKRLLRLRAWANDKLIQERLAQFIKETEERLRQLESATGDRDA